MPGSNGWRHVITDSAFVEQGEILDVKQAKVDIPLNRTRTGSLLIRLDNALAPFIAQRSSYEPLYLKSYRKGTLLAFNPIQSALETYTEDQKAQLSITTAGPEVILTERLAGRSALGLHLEGGKAGDNLAKKFVKLLDESNKEANGETFIDYEGLSISCTNNSEYESTPFRYLSEVLIDMYNQANGFDWTIYPREPEGTENKIGQLEIADVIGTEKPNALFEWGGGRANVATYSRAVDLSKLANKGFNITSAGPEATGAPTVSNADLEEPLKKEAEEQQLIWGIREAMITSSVLNLELRKRLLAEAVQVRMRPRQTVTMSPIPELEGEAHESKVPIFEEDFSIGDTVPMKISYEGNTHFAGDVRIWGVGFVVDENGKETQTLTLSDS